MWSQLFQDLVSAAEEDAAADSAPTITLTDTSADIMLLLSCLYPASHHPDRPQGSTLDAPSCLRLLSLADKYHCPHIIHRCASFALENVLPRLSGSASAAEAAEYLHLHVTSPAAAATAAADWVVRCLELAVRLELTDLADEAARLLGRRFFEWELQSNANKELLTRAAHSLAPELFVELVLRSVTPPTPASPAAASPSKHAPASPARGAAAGAGRVAAYGAAGAAAGGGAGPRIVPVVVAAAGPAAAVDPQAAVPPAPAPAPAAAAAAAQPQLLHPNAPAGPAPFQEHFPQHHPHHHMQQHPQQLQQHHHANLHQPAFWQIPHFAMAAAAHGGGGGGGVAHGQPEPLLGPGPAGW
ncbi:hypothetical protein GPECTOR_28g754 [Gonium pectorale]|uniref:BTB domain-containing protein n=1 Tax=Gonium pectorale TaxID=33097 RepID=A0A150GER4_GONPE|nr:hypothetical protein GPECTOR_28g754 [Gonium pectorale]|eukprot:KXZ48347.1 hypothetical protein GPECTOR_28g754 [Gonium pectorale]